MRARSSFGITPTFRQALLIALTAGLLSLSGCGAGEAGSEAAEADAAAAESGRYTVVTTTGMIRDIVENIAGDQARVTNLMGEGVDPHLYSPTRGDVNRILNADLVFYNGHMLEGRMGEVFDQAARRGRPIHAVAELLDEDLLLEADEDDLGYYDPHVWMDVSLWSKVVDAVADVLADFDPPHADLYRENASTYRAELDALHEYARTAIESIPDEQRVIITAHDAFRYFGRAYGIEVVGVQGLSTDSSAGLADINRLIDRVVEQAIPAIFAESSIPEQNIVAIRNGARSRDHRVDTSGTLFSDAMGPASTYEGTYIGMIDHNVTTITRALGGEAPARGFQGTLTADR